MWVKNVDRSILNIRLVLFCFGMLCFCLLLLFCWGSFLTSTPLSKDAIVLHQHVYHEITFELHNLWEVNVRIIIVFKSPPLLVDPPASFS